MRYYADLHIHSKYSRATSKDCDLEHLAWWAARKGIAVVGTGDFTHPAWYEELSTKLVPAEPGFFRLAPEIERAVLARLPRACQQIVRFMLSVEISTIYKRGPITRKIHHLVYAPSLESAGEFNRRLGRVGNLKADGRPILGLDSRDLLEIALESGPDTFLVPAHIWTPWFAVLGSKSGFDAVADCYRDLAHHIVAVETGLSSDPPMNWRVSSLDKYRLISNSDAHSPPMLGREANVFETDLDYYSLKKALETGKGFGGTLEFFPEEGKYHLDGHRACQVRLEPQETRALHGKCPVCANPITVGVLARVEALADRKEGAAPSCTAPYTNLVPLPEMIAEIRQVGKQSKAVEQDVALLVDRLGPELAILQSVPLEDVQKQSSSLLVEALTRLRRGQVHRQAGYDGEYGVIRLFEPNELATKVQSGWLFEEPSTKTAPTPQKKQRLSKASKKIHSEPVFQATWSKSSAAQTGLLEDLDPEQRAAAEVMTGPLLVLAGPGTGKTRMLTYRLAHAVRDKHVKPESCLAVTFTQRAAQEMRQRLERLLPMQGKRVNVMTFHALGLEIVREQRSWLGFHRGVRIASDFEVEALVGELFGAKAQLKTLNEEQRLCFQKTLWERDLVTLDDLIRLPVELLETHQEMKALYQARFRFVLVDEYQDIDALQYRLVRALVPDGGNLAVVGDPDQAIYAFRGADVNFFLRFAEDYSQAARVELVRNYRSSECIVKGALGAIAPTSLVQGRALKVSKESSTQERIRHVEVFTERSEAEYVVSTVEKLMGGTSHFSLHSGRATGTTQTAFSFADFAVLYRTDAQSQPLIEAFARSGIPYQKRSHARLIEQPGVRELVSTLQNSERARAAKSTSIQEQMKSLLREVRDSSEQHALFEKAVDLVAPLAERWGADLEHFFAELALGVEVDTWDARAARVSLLTLHACKGLEFPVVFIVGCEEGLLPLTRANKESTLTDASIAEERRLFFVGMTRAQDLLFLSHAQKRLVHGRKVERTPSRFLADIQETWLEHQAQEIKNSRNTPTGPEQMLLGM